MLELWQIGNFATLPGLRWEACSVETLAGLQSCQACSLADLLGSGQVFAVLELGLSVGTISNCLLLGQ